MSSILYIILALVMLGVIIFVHEFGHYIVGKAMGIGVLEFSIGMGPKLFGWTGKQKAEDVKPTQYSLRLIPLGGYCAFEGEDSDSASKRAMNNQPAWKRALTVVAGPMMNFILAFVLATGLIAGGQIYNIYAEPQVVPYVYSTIEDMPARQAGLEAGDVITGVNGQTVTFDEAGYNTLKKAIEGCAEGESLDLTLERDGETMTVSVTPSLDEEGNKLMGVHFTYAYVSYDCNVLTAMPEALSFMWNTAKATWNALIDLVRDLFTGQQIEEGTVSGVVGIVSAVSDDLQVEFAEKFSSGLLTIAYYIMAISLSLGIMNMLPLPALDGGRFVLLLIEAVTGKHLKRETEGKINLIALFVLIALMLLITFFDVKSLLK